MNIVVVGGGGVVEVRFSGRMRILSVSIDKELFRGKISDEDLEKLDLTELEDLIVEAILCAQDKL